MKLKNFQNCIAALITCALFLFTMTIVIICLGSSFVALGCLLLAMLPVRLTVDTYLDLRNYVCTLEKRYIHRMLREDGVWRPLANHLLKVAGVPTEIPSQALFALYPDRDSMSLTAPYSPLDYDVYWCKGESSNDNNWYWRRTDKPIVAVQLPNGRWETQSASS